MKTKDQLIQYLNKNVIPAVDFNQSTSKSIFNKFHTLCTDALNALGSTKEEALRSLIKPNGGTAKRNITKLKETLSTGQALDGKFIADTCLSTRPQTGKVEYVFKDVKLDTIKALYEHLAPKLSERQFLLNLQNLKKVSKNRQIKLSEKDVIDLTSDKPRPDLTNVKKTPITILNTDGSALHTANNYVIAYKYVTDNLLSKDVTPVSKFSFVHRLCSSKKEQFQIDEIIELALYTQNRYSFDDFKEVIANYADIHQARLVGTIDDYYKEYKNQNLELEFECFICKTYFNKRLVKLKINSKCPKHKNYLGENTVLLVAQKMFDHNFFSAPIKHLKFDMFCKPLNLAIEYDGHQHFKKNDAFHKTKADFNKQVKNDRKKDKYCEEANITLIRVPYHVLSHLYDSSSKTSSAELSIRKIYDFIEHKLKELNYNLGIKPVDEVVNKLEPNLYKQIFAHDPIKQKCLDIAKKKNVKLLGFCMKGTRKWVTYHCKDCQKSHEQQVDGFIKYKRSIDCNTK